VTSETKKAGLRLHAVFDTLSHYHEVAEVGAIMRRYFVINAFDGVLTTLGVLAGGYLAGVDKARAVVSVILTTAVGIGVAGFYGSYLVERAERDRSMRELEESTLSSLQDTDISSASTYATVVIAFVDGVSPLLTAVIAMAPFFFTSVISVHAAYFFSGGIAFVELFLLGLFLGRVSRERLLYSGVKLVAAGLVALGLSWLIGRGVR
jgi:predicted membrane protein (TIGR00267 family)